MVPGTVLSFTPRASAHSSSVLICIPEVDGVRTGVHGAAQEAVGPRQCDRPVAALHPAPKHPHRLLYGDALLRRVRSDADGWQLATGARGVGLNYPEPT